MTLGTNYQSQFCPLCAGANKCQLATDGDVGECWCRSEQFPSALLAQEAAAEHRKRCICRPCLEKAQKLSYAG